MEAILQEKWHRNQVELALWRYFLFYEDWGDPKGKVVDEVPRRFKSSIRKLLMLDRQLSDQYTTAPDKWVFFESEGEGTGSEERFSDFHVFLLGFALDVWKVAGWKQSEVIFFLRHRREALRKEYFRLRTTDLPRRVFKGTRCSHGITEYPDAMEFGEGIADPACFVMITRDFPEVHSSIKLADSSAPSDRLLFSPRIARGCQALANELHDHAITLRTLIVVEISDMAQSLHGLLEEVEVKRKGRPKA